MGQGGPKSSATTWSRPERWFADLILILENKQIKQLQTAPAYFRKITHNELLLSAYLELIFKEVVAQLQPGCFPNEKGQMSKYAAL